MFKGLRRRFFNNGRLAAEICSNADQLRNARLWKPAAQLYKSCLDLRPKNAAIWIQLGHCQKEAGLLDDADFSYAQAAAMTPGDADLWLQIGHLRKLQGRISEAITNYSKALEKQPTLMPARLELEALGFAPSSTSERHTILPQSGSSDGGFPSKLGQTQDPMARVPEPKLDQDQSKMIEVGVQLTDMNEQIVAHARHIDRLLELLSTVKAIGFAMKRQEGRAAEMMSRLDALETQLGGLQQKLLTDGPARLAANGHAGTKFTASDSSVR